MPLKWLAREIRHNWKVLTYRLPEQSPVSRPAAPRSVLIGRWHCVVRAHTPNGPVVVASGHFGWLAADAAEVAAELERRARLVDPQWTYECTATPAVKP